MQCAHSFLKLYDCHVLVSATQGATEDGSMTTTAEQGRMGNLLIGPSAPPEEPVTVSAAMRHVSKQNQASSAAWVAPTSDAILHKGDIRSYTTKRNEEVNKGVNAEQAEVQTMPPKVTVSNVCTVHCTHCKISLHSRNSHI